MQMRSERLEQPSPLIMKSLAKEFFKKTLNAQLYTIKQGQSEHLHAHLIGKPCTIYENEIFSSIDYSKSHIKVIEGSKLPMCPSAKHIHFLDVLYFCIYSYNLDKNSKPMLYGPKKCEKEKTKSPIKAAIPLMSVPKNTVLSTYLIFPKKNFNDFILSKEQIFESDKIRDFNESQHVEDISFSFQMINDEQLYIFMNNFANYLYTDANKDLLEMKRAKRH